MHQEPYFFGGFGLPVRPGISPGAGGFGKSFSSFLISSSFRIAP